ncbi:MAG: glycosyltransferase family 4 protein [Syntrophaceae bacterium]|nr:glycosyltransferase family 4 protein [Syntrophaceae bacterium]
MGSWLRRLPRKILDFVPVEPEDRRKVFLNNKTAGKNILFVDYEVPRYDMYAGSRANYLYLKLLAGLGHNVKLLPADFRGVEPYTTQYEKEGIDVLHGAWFRKNWHQWIKEVADGLDVVFFNKPDPTTIFLDSFRLNTNAKILYQMHDLHYLRLQGKYEIEQDEKLFNIASIYRKKEEEIFSKADVILTFSSKEKEILLKEMPDKQIEVVPLYFYEKMSDRKIIFESCEGILFVGGFGHSPNVDAVNWFVKDIFPQVVEKIPHVRFFIVGGNPPSRIRDLSSENVKLLGQVSDVELVNIYNRVRLVVIPLRFGAGVKGKTVEALYHGVPVVSTSVGVEGIEDILDIIKPIDDPYEFSNEIVKYYNDIELLRCKAEEARVFVEQKFNYSVAAGLIDRIVRAH